MIYAPIIIPTLNRIEHLRRCIKSLQNNPWARYTPLIISVDYPPEDKYRDGYHKVCEYLKNGIEGFGDVKIFYQEKNLGAYENEKFLLKYIEGNFDRYIFTEDDNEFSPNFIEYIDKGLEIFENDERIITICASGAPNPEDEENNVILSQNYTGYGCGTWLKKDKDIRKQINRDFLFSIVGNLNLLLELAQKQSGLLLSLQSAVFRKEKLYQLPDNEVPLIDQTKKLYLISEKKYVVSACIRKGRTWGRDGSGVNCPKDDNYHAEMIEIDTREHFEYRFSVPIKESVMKDTHSLGSICRIIAAIIKLKVWRLKVRVTGNSTI